MLSRRTLSHSRTGLLSRAYPLAAFLGLLLLSAGASTSAQPPPLTVLHNFTRFDGGWPYDSLTVGPDGNFYGTTTYGGNGFTNDVVPSGSGVIFKITPDGSYSILHAFSAVTYNGTNFINADGASPIWITLGADGNFYGSAAIGGPNGLGTIYSITPAGVYTNLYFFTSSDTANSAGTLVFPLIQETDGNFYAATTGGSNGDGSLVKFTPGGPLTTLFTFPVLADDAALGADPGSLILASDGNFYGIAAAGGAYNHGVIFRFTPDGTYTVLHNFNGDDGDSPNAQLMQASDGDLYGTTVAGGPYNTGTIFKISLDGTFTSLYTFSFADSQNQNADGRSPVGLIQGSDGNLYGAAGRGGANDHGTLFQITPSGAFTLLYVFPSATAGSPAAAQWPDAPPIEGPDGYLYGTTEWGGLPDTASGTIYRLNYNVSPAPPHLLFQNPATGQLAAWILAGKAVTGDAIVNPDQNPNWQVAGEADFNADGHSDILFQNANTGQLAVWFMNKVSATGGRMIATTPPPGWKAVSLADFNGDGYPDILLQNRSTGQLALWLMKGTNPISGQFLGAPPAGWHVVGTGDFNHDGKPDILLQNGNTGQLAVWFMNGTGVMGGAYITPTQDPAWQAVAVKDLNGDGHPDIVFQNTSTGQVVYWLMKGTAALDGNHFSPSLPAGWKVVASH